MRATLRRQAKKLQRLHGSQNYEQSQDRHIALWPRTVQSRTGSGPYYSDPSVR